MGIYIKGLKMPKSCTECFLYRYDDRLRNEEERHICLRKCWARLVRPTEERQGYCPLVEVKTPHGRLIDENEVLKWAYEIDEMADRPIVVERRDIEDSDTVIEGED